MPINQAMDRRATILKIIQAVSKKNTSPSPEESLFDSGLLDSFALTDLVAELEKQFGIRIPDADLNSGRLGAKTLIQKRHQPSLVQSRHVRFRAQAAQRGKPRAAITWRLPAPGAPERRREARRRALHAPPTPRRTCAQRRLAR